MIDATIEPGLHKKSTKKTFINNGLPFPGRIPPQHPERSEEVVFDAKIHLDINNPPWIQSLDFSQPKLASTDGVQLGKDYPGLAYSAPFRVLSDEGVRIFKQVVLDHAHLAKSTDRAPKVSIVIILYPEPRDPSFLLLVDLTFHPEFTGASWPGLSIEIRTRLLILSFPARHDVVYGEQTCLAP